MYVVFVLVYLDISLIRFFEFTVDDKRRLHLSQYEVFRAGPIVHKCVQFVLIKSVIGIFHVKHVY